MFLQSASAQTINATLTGHVEDSQGAAIAGATITVKNTGTGAARSTPSDANGLYTVTNLQPGAYEVTVTMSGFTTKTMTGIKLNVGDTHELPVSLTVGGVNDTVNVEAAEPLLQTQTSSNGILVDNKQVTELPLANRQFYALALLSPGTYQPAQNSTLGFRGGINVAGASEISNQFTLNGIFDNDMGVAQPSFRPSVEVIQEFRVLTGVYAAEYGRMSGGQAVIITKSGTNALHGSAYEFIRNEITDAKPYFTAAGAKKPSFKQNTFGATAGGPIWKDRTFFFFGYEGQRIRRAVTAQATVPTTDMLTSGIFQTGSTLYDPSTGKALTPLPGTSGSLSSYNLSTQLPTLWNSAAAQAGQLVARMGYPTPSIGTAAGKAPSNNYNFQETRVENMDEYSLRIDHKLTEKDNIFGSWNFFKDPAFEPSNSLCSSYVVPKFGCYTNQISTLVNVTYDRVVTANLFNDLRLGFQRLQQPRVQEDSTAIGSSYSGLPGGPYFTQAGYANNQGLPNTAVSGYSTIGGATNLPQNRWDNHYQLVDSLSWIHGAHSFKFGADWLWANSVNVITSSGRGALTFNDATLKSNNKSVSGFTGDSMADLLLGLPLSTSIGTTAGTVYLNFRSTHLFVQDDWKLSPTLTLNLGLRWELDAPVYSPHNTVSRFDLSAGRFSQAGVGGFTHLYNYDWNNFAPRVGFSWQPRGHETTVLKGGFGVFYNAPLLYNQFLNTGTQYPLRLVPTYTSKQTVATNVTLANPFPSGGLDFCGIGPNFVNYALKSDGTATCAASLSPLSVNPGYRTPYITEWSFGLQQALTKTIVFETTYFGSKGTRLPLSINLNQINVNTLAQGASTSQAGRPFANFSTVNNQDTRSNSAFHSWLNSLKKSYSNGVAFTVAYTWAKSIDGGGGIGSGSNSSGSPQDIYNLRAERALSDFNVAHRLVFSPVAELPFGRGKKWLTNGVGSALAGGWQLSGIFQFQTGRPFTVSNSSSNNSGSFQSADRPLLIGDPNAATDSVTGAKTRTVQEWFNIHAYQLAPTTRFGNAGRNQVIGPRFTSVDLTLSKNFPIYERINGQFRAESFNLLNHSNFFNPLSQGLQFPGTTTAPTVASNYTGTFGAITQAYDPRDLQFSLRVLF
ncbi:carboxypeptidase regulatory-like domain-containing protein [Terriglobus sp. 2YAB30_2]|uniref:TonB-dependent receptor n=2 Tax=unclassified Terriglobus TaxID=2628988 RepID=UPI003F9627A6